MDTLEISGLEIKTHIGIHAWEQKILQTLIVDIRVPLDCSQCQELINNTLDYDDLCKTISNFVESQSFQLIETVADKAATMIKERYCLPEVVLTVSKPQAIKNAKNVKVTVTR